MNNNNFKNLQIFLKNLTKYGYTNKEVFPSLTLQGFWALKYENNKLVKKVYIKEY